MKQGLKNENHNTDNQKKTTTLFFPPIKQWTTAQLPLPLSWDPKRQSDGTRTAAGLEECGQNSAVLWQAGGQSFSRN